MQFFTYIPEDLVLYTLRHNFASRLIKNKVDLYTVSKLMGHSNINTTIKYYAHLQDTESLDVVNQFADLVA
ncbi:MAG: tyrosine-type recombinase/integrase [gamma proteobacterium symbiont of Taylorina sp.]|nr:tyrosine-type recombinase/integrase [gamma proteobacterium symbiont of Taylorina sp.]